jgi:hypothetical protein
LPLDEEDAPSGPALLLTLYPTPLLEDEDPFGPAFDELEDVPPGGSVRLGLSRRKSSLLSSSDTAAAATTPATGVQTTPGGRIHLSSGITAPWDSAQQKTFTSLGLSVTQPASSKQAEAGMKTVDQGRK